MKRLFLLLAVLVFCNSVMAQSEKEYQPLFSFNMKYEAPATAAMFVAGYLGFNNLKDKPRLTLEKLNSLSKDNVWFFDRNALNQDASYRIKAHELSDWGLNISLFLPGVLALDNKIRKEWVQLLGIYLEAQAISNIAYAWGPTLWTKRIRPLAYYDDVSLKERMGSGTTDSFFSGHVATTATSSFFMAKIFTEFHPELGNKKYLIYGAALIPPTFVAIMRYKALKHFPTDLVAGMFVGAGIGILIPELHKTKNDNGLTLLPLVGAVNGLSLSYQIK